MTKKNADCTALLARVALHRSEASTHCRGWDLDFLSKARSRRNAIAAADGTPQLRFPVHRMLSRKSTNSWSYAPMRTKPMRGYSISRMTKTVITAIAENVRVAISGHQLWVLFQMAHAHAAADLQADQHAHEHRSGER